MRAISYFRVSTAAQGRSGLGLEAQKAAIGEFAAQRGLQLIAEFTEVESGKRSDRPQLVRALNQARVTGAVMVIAKLDRLSRNAAFLLTLRDSGVRFLAADLPDANDLTIGVMAVIAQAEREAISRRTTDALQAIHHRLSATGSHTSMRSGRTIHRLGNPNGSKALHRNGSSNEAALTAVAAAADFRARDMATVIREVQARGWATYSSIAAKLNEDGILTPRRGRWHAGTVRNLMSRLKAMNAEGLPTSSASE